MAIVFGFFCDFFVFFVMHYPIIARVVSNQVDW